MVRGSLERGPTWRGWQARRSGKAGSVTSAALPAAAGVRNRLFPKTRSWFALGAPLELMSPLSILRVLYALAFVAWPVEGVAGQWPSSRLGWLLGPTLAALGVWLVLRRVGGAGKVMCHLLALLASLLTLTVAWAAAGPGTLLVALFFLVPVACFVALFLGSRAVLAHQGLVSGALCLVLVRQAGVPAGLAASALAGIMLLACASVVRLLTASAWSRGAIDPETGTMNGLGLAARLGGGAGAFGGDEQLVLAVVHLAGLEDARQALGYQIGTELLRRAVEDLGQVVPAGALIARVEADELVVASRCGTGAVAGGAGQGTVPEELVGAGFALSSDLARAIEAGRYLVNGVEVSLSGHVGLVFAPWDGTEVAELVRRASLSARQAASRGLEALAWEGDRDTFTSQDLAMLADLRTAQDNGELWLAYQPQVAALTRSVEAVEALMRWDSPVHGQVPPGRFILLAERTGLIWRLTEWALRQALDAQVRWREEGIEVPVSVNFSAKTLSRPGLGAWVIDELAARRLPASSLTVEVTETAAADLADAVRVLGSLYDRGIRVSIDDFGTGFTSLASIPYLPLSEIKVDMQFVKRAPTSPADEAIVRSVQDLARRLGLVTVAEGVEDQKIVDLMVEIGFDLLQGYHFARGLPEAELLAMLRKVRSKPRAAGSTLAL